MNPTELWEMLGCCFQLNDGFIYSLYLENLQVSEIGEIYELIRQNSTLKGEPYYWDIAAGTEKALADAINPVLLVCNGKAEPFVFGTTDLSYNNIKIPELGFSICKDSIDIHYSADDAWGPQEVFALFSWLKTIMQTTKSATLNISGYDGTLEPEMFAKAWEKFLG